MKVKKIIVFLSMGIICTVFPVLSQANVPVAPPPSAQPQVVYGANPQALQMTMNVLRSLIAAIDQFHLKSGTNDMAADREIYGLALKRIAEHNKNMQEELVESQQLQKSREDQAIQQSAKQQYNALVVQLSRIIQEINRLTQSAVVQGQPQGQGSRMPAAPNGQFQAHPQPVQTQGMMPSIPPRAKVIPSAAPPLPSQQQPLSSAVQGTLLQQIQAQRERLKKAPPQQPSSQVSPVNQGALAQQIQAQRKQLKTVPPQQPSFQGRTPQPGAEKANWSQMSVKERAAALQGIVRNAQGSVPQIPR